MFEHEQLLKSTPLFSWLLVMTITAYWAYVHFFEEGSILAKLSLDVGSVVHLREVHRLVTGPLYAGVPFRSLMISVMGAHIGSWFVISAFDARWERILMAFWFNYGTYLLYGYYIDPLSLQFPLVMFITSMVATTFLMQEVSASVSVMVSNITILWLVIVFLTQPYQPLIGVVIAVI